MSEIFVEDWAAAYGSPYMVASEDAGANAAEPVEDGPELRRHPGGEALAAGESLAFVDGVRRGEAGLYRMTSDGALARGVAGAHACGAVVAGASGPAVVDEVRVRRTVIWGGGEPLELPPVPGGWAWRSESVQSLQPEVPLRELQTRMREAEGRLAEDLCERGHLVVVDGSLSFVRSRGLPVVGYVKTHHRALLAPDLHRRVPRLEAGERTSLFAVGCDRYSCYLRLAPPGPTSGPWSGIVRLEMPQSAGLERARAVAHRMAGLLPRFAGVAHRDPRAPQNLQPVGALERHLRHLLGDAGLAARAVREAALQAGRAVAA